ncbi:MAG: hypothetical protein ABGY09_00280 [Euryarchaeota archaeon]
MRLALLTLIGVLTLAGTPAAASLQDYRKAYLDAAKIEEYGGKLREALDTIGGFQPPCGLKAIPTAYPYMAFKDDKSAIQTAFKGTDVAGSSSWAEVGPGDFRALIYGIGELGNDWFKRVSTVVDLAQEPARWALKVHEETHSWEEAVETTVQVGNQSVTVGETWKDWDSALSQVSGNKDAENKVKDAIRRAIASRTLAVLGLVVSGNWRAIFNEPNKAARVAENLGSVEIPAGVYGNQSPITLDFSECETPEDVATVIKDKLISVVFNDNRLTPDYVIQLIDKEAEHFGLVGQGKKFVETYLEGGSYQPHPGGFTKDEMKKVIELFKQGKDVYGQSLSEDALAFAVLFSIEDVWAAYEEYVHQYGHFFPPAADDAKLARDEIQKAVGDLESVLDKLNAWADVGVTKAKLESNPIECAPAVKDWAVGRLFDEVRALQQKVSRLEQKVSSGSAAQGQQRLGGQGGQQGGQAGRGKGPVSPVIALLALLAALGRRR